MGDLDKALIGVLLFILVIALVFELTYPGNCSFIEYVFREIIFPNNGYMCSEETIFSRI